ncbi:hypothetical protein DTF03_19810 [Salmonella enterica subsp. enterica serovar Krefeld]|nr:hypothetical protein LFZ24_13380 [Salmonella enterica subsp. enterica serovar Krefeld str. SA20030536]EBH8891231.1 hypothetical protein [Salmonella enterica subsp. enterica serovar Krefeld]EBI4179340.1 hypothetical protein [Salmonella enterica]ECD3897780.1 hypothetical protein [Salmonella enterica subsp. enterica serovar Gloucester]EBI5272299.1 hypothetical protein [Salmonella enterica]
MPDGGYALSGLQGYQYVIIRRPDKRSAIRRWVRRRLGRAQRNVTFGIRFRKQAVEQLFQLFS